jgi:glutamate:GABA antiporter
MQSEEITGRDPLGTDTAAGLAEEHKLKKVVGKTDTFLVMLCALVGLDTLGAVSSYGAQSIVWLAVLAVFFFVPYAMVCAELGSAFPEQGGPYVWTKLAFGRLTASIASVFYWVSTPVWLGGTLAITGVATFSEFFFHLGGVGQYIFAFIFIWVAVTSAILSFQVGKWIPAIGAYVRVILLSGFTLTVIIYAFVHGVHGFSIGDFKPTYSVFILAAPVLFFNFEGFELPSTAAGEMTDPQKNVPIAIARGAIGTVIMYGAPILAILIVLPVNQVDSLGGFVDAIKTVFTVYGGHVAHDGTATLTGFGKVLGDIAAAGFIWALLSSGSSWLMGSDRTQSVAGYDGSAPRSLGILSERFGTPIVVNILSGIIATVLMVMAFVITSGNAAKYFEVVLGVAISTSAFAYCIFFPTVIKLRYSHPQTPRPYRIPGGTLGVWIAGGLATLWAVFACVMLVWPGLGTSDPNSSLVSYGFSHQRAQFELAQFIPLLAFVVIALIFYVLGRPTREATADPGDPPMDLPPAPAGATA